MGLLNLGLSAYNTYQLHSVKKLQEATNGKLEQMAGNLSHLQTALHATAGSVDELHGKVDMLDTVLQDCLSKLSSALEDQETLLRGVLAQGSALQQGQAALMHGQQMMMTEMLSLHADVQQGNAAIMAVSTTSVTVAVISQNSCCCSQSKAGIPCTKCSQSFAANICLLAAKHMTGDHWSCRFVACTGAEVKASRCHSCQVLEAV